MFEPLCRKSSEEATKERQMFFNLLKDAQVLLVLLTVQYFVKETGLYQCFCPVIIIKSFADSCHCFKQAVQEILNLRLGHAV